MLKIFKIFVVVLILILFMATYFAWPGAKLTYVIFSIAFTSLLYLAIKKRLSAGYVFLAVVLWIGYWLKLSIHISEPTLPWMEPTGLFNFSSDAWDEVAIVASVGAIGVLVGGLFFHSRVEILKNNLVLDERAQSFRVLSWLVGLGVLFGIVALNEFFNIVHQSVPPSVHGFPWHLQGLFNWCMGGGGLMFLMIPLYFEVISGRFLRGAGLVLGASLAVGVSLWSRGTVVFQSLIIGIAFFTYRAYLPRPNVIQILKFFSLIVIGVALSVVLSEVRREVFFASVQPASVQPASVQPASVQPVSVQPASVQPASVQPIFSSYSLFLILKLPVERWIGLEGVMAMSAHPGKGIELLIRAIKERRVIGEVDMYTHKVALSPTKDTKTVMYATPPSFFAFWYYSGSLLVVFIASAMLAMMILAAELIIMKMSDNPFLSAAVGIGGAIQIVHMGTGGLLIPAVIFVTSLVFALLIGSWSRYYAYGRQY